MALQRLSGLEIAARDLDALGDEIGQKAGSDPGRREVPLDGSILERPGADEFVDFLHLENVAFHTGDLRDAGDLALAVGQARKLDNDPDRRRDLAADARYRHRQAGHAYHL